MIMLQHHVIVWSLMLLGLISPVMTLTATKAKEAVTEPNRFCGKKVIITSEGNENLQDSYGKAKLTPNSDTWEMWDISDAGGGKVFIKSHRNQYLKDHNDKARFDSHAGNWEKWTIKDRDNGKVIIESHSGKKLQDNNGNSKPVTLTTSGSKVKWTITEVGQYHGKHIELEFGGEKKNNNVGGSSVFLHRPEIVKSLQCKSLSECSDCTSQSGCWRGHGGGHMKVALTAAQTRDNGYAVFEVFVKCKDNNAKITLRVKSQNNAKLRVFRDGNELWSYSGQSTEKDIPGMKGNVKGRLRVVLEVTNKGSAANSEVELEADGIDEYTDQCMDMKECLENFGDGSDAGFDLRNDNRLQLACLLEGEGDQSLTSAQQTKCDAWLQCLKDPARGKQGKRDLDALITTLKVAVGTVSSSSLQQASIGARGFFQRHERLVDVAGQKQPKSGDCFNPSVDDIEALQCDCLKVALKQCNTGEDDAACLRRYLCGHSGVCDTWRSSTNNCPPGLSMLTEVASKLNRSRVTLNLDARGSSDSNEESRVWTKEAMKRRSANAKDEQGLDGSLSDKCQE